MATRTLQRMWKALGPGLVTGAADDDPSGIATYSQAGAQFGYALTWTMFLTLPFMAAIQIISAWIGWQTRKGLADNLARELPAPVLLALVALLVVAKDRKSTRLNSSHVSISYAVFCLKKKIYDKSKDDVASTAGHDRAACG